MNEHIIERKAEEFYNYIMQYGTPFMVTSLDAEDLKKFVEREFDKYGLNFMVIGEFTGWGEAKIKLHIKTGTPLKSTEELKKLLDAEVNAYLRELEDDMTACKNWVYKRLQRYQVDQKPDTFE